jgi:hypothetical protein
MACHETRGPAGNQRGGRRDNVYQQRTNVSSVFPLVFPHLLVDRPRVVRVDQGSHRPGLHRLRVCAFKELVWIDR